MAVGPLSSQMLALCDDLVARVDPMVGGQVRQVRARLDEPLRVAVAGRLKAGKSTLVNALIGRRVAPTAVGECTRVVTVFRYGPADRIDVVRRDGSRASLPLDDDGMIPQRLGVPTAQVAYVDVSVTSDRLRELTVVDTPGLASTDPVLRAQATRAVAGGAPAADPPEGAGTGAPFEAGFDDASVAAVTAAEAVVYVFTQAIRADDVAALQAFKASSVQVASSPINALGVFGKVDTLVGGADDPWPVAEPLARTQSQVLARMVSQVIPVVGLLAETGEAGRLTAGDCAALRQLAASPADELAVLLTSVDLFRSRASAVPVAVRERLLALLDLYGIGFAVAQLSADPQLGTGELVRLLVRASGFPRLRHTVEQAFRWRTDAIKAGWALSRLEALARRAGEPGDAEALRGGVERLLQLPAYHRLRLLDVAQRVATGAVALPADWEHELIRLATSDDAAWILALPQADAAQLADAALAAAKRWRAFANAGASPAQSRVASVTHRGFYLLAQAVRAQAVRAAAGQR